MTKPSATVLPPERLRPLDRACDDFERQWIDGQRPSVEDYLPETADDLRLLVREELIRLELEWRCRRGERPVPAEYADRFPECAADVAAWLAEAQAAAAAVAASTYDVAAAMSTQDVQDTPAGQATHPAPVPAAETMPVRRLGEYELLQPLGEGGMGQVWKARHRRLDKLVAVKLLHVHRQASLLAVERFLREIKALGRLDHPNVVEASDAGEQAGIVYLVMKLVEGTDLARLVRERGPLPVAEACTLVRQAARGLSYLHERGLVHRDIKPSNLLRTPEGTVKVLDLGLASWRGAGPAEELTAAGQVLGTPDFLAPEQIGNAAAVDVRADLYGLGATLFFLLTGKAPFAHRAGVYGKMKAHQEEAAPDVRTLRPDVPAALAALVARLLAKRPEDRPQTPAEVADELAAWSADQTATLPPRTARPLGGAWRRGRRPWAWAAGLAVLVGLNVLVLWQDRPPEVASVRQSLRSTAPEPPAAVEPLRVVRLDVQHFAAVRQDGKDFQTPRGLLGRDSFACRLDDQVTMEAVLSRPAYAYLLAYRPDGTEEVCFPEKEDEPPPLTDRPRYPSVSRGDQYGLNEGTGLAAFAVVASSRPLPAYREWRKGPGTSPWGKYQAPAGVAWYYDGSIVDVLTPQNRDRGQRGKGQEAAGRTPLVRLVDWLRQGEEVETAAGLALVVLPRVK